MCIQYAKWIDGQEPFALELYNTLGRKPTLSEVRELEEKIIKRDAPKTKREKAEEACERLFT